jgi:hypothetical protein
MREFKGIDGTGENRDNREISYRACSVFSVSFVSHLCERATMDLQLTQASGLSYDVSLRCMKLLDIPLGLIIKFNELKLTNGVSRLVFSGANFE